MPKMVPEISFWDLYKYGFEHDISHLAYRPVQSLGDVLEKQGPARLLSHLESEEGQQDRDKPCVPRQQGTDVRQFGDLLL
jgi:hypothetical protein